MGAAGPRCASSEGRSVLEEELAAGINTTQKHEKKVVDVDKLRAGDPQEVIQRFRRDAHDVVDILLDLVNVATNCSTSLPSASSASGRGARADQPL